MAVRSASADFGGGERGARARRRGLSRNPAFVGCALFFALAALSFASLSTGSSGADFSLPFDILFGGEVGSSAELIFFQIRLPRLCVALIAGVSLSLAGATMQALFRNPLADPSVMGVSAGAALGAVVAMSFFGGALSLVSLQIGAVVFGLAATAFVCALGRGGKILSCLLGGIAVNALCGAVVGFFLYSAREAGLKSYIFWMLGSLDNADWNSIAHASLVSVPAWIAVMACARGLNALLLGWEQAYHSGVRVKLLWRACVAATSLMTAAAVSICGIIGFVGLVIPHIMRLWTGPDNRRLLPLSALAGALLMVGADLLSRAANPADPVPIGVITSLLGVPFFIFLLKFGKGEK